MLVYPCLAILGALSGVGVLRIFGLTPRSSWLVASVPMYTATVTAALVSGRMLGFSFPSTGVAIAGVTAVLTVIGATALVRSRGIERWDAAALAVALIAPLIALW